MSMGKIMDIEGQKYEREYQLQEERRLAELQAMEFKKAMTNSTSQKPKYKTRDFWIEEMLKFSFKGLLGYIVGYLIYFFTK